MITAAPDFIGIGMGKSGTTWWLRLIEEHPGVHRDKALNKERQYLRYHLTECTPTEAHRDAYAAWFPRPADKLAGEWTAWYLGHPWLGQALQVVAPEAKILVILRDPLERYISGITNVGGEKGRVEPLNPGSENFQFVQGLYSLWLSNLEPYVARDRMLVLQYERCVADPEGELARTQRFLGLDVQIPDNLREPRNPTKFSKIELDAERRRVLTHAYEADVAALVARYPEIDRSLWPNFA
jgi:hypothetical protein